MRKYAKDKHFTLQRKLDLFRFLYNSFVSKEIGISPEWVVRKHMCATRSMLSQYIFFSFYAKFFSCNVLIKWICRYKEGKNSTYYNSSWEKTSLMQSAPFHFIASHKLTQMRMEMKLPKKKIIIRGNFLLPQKYVGKDSSKS